MFYRQTLLAQTSKFILRAEWMQFVSALGSISGTSSWKGSQVAGDVKELRLGAWLTRACCHHGPRQYMKGKGLQPVPDSSAHPQPNGCSPTDSR